MPEAIADFKLVETQAIELHERWLTYRRLFGERSRRELLNGSGSALFSLVAELFREGILSSLARLTDQDATYSKENVTIRMLPQLCLRIEQQLQGEIAALIQRVDALKKLRHKLVGHTDRLEARQLGVRAVPEFDEGEMEEVLSMVRQIVDSARDEIGGRTIHFDYEVNTVDEVEYLIGVLNSAATGGGS